MQFSNAISLSNEEYYKNYLAKTKYTIEDKLSFINNLALTLLQNRKFRVLLDKYENKSINEIGSDFDFLYAQSELRDISYTNEFIEDAVFYLGSNKCIIHNYGLKSSSLFFDKLYQNKIDNLNFEYIIKNSFKWNNLYYSRPTELLINDNLKDVFIFAKTLQSNEDEIYASALVLINKKMFDNLLPSFLSSNESHSFIIDESNTIIAGSAFESMLDLPYSFYEGEDMITKFFGNKRQNIFWTQIDGMPWKLIIFLPLNSISSSQYFYLSFFVIIILFILFIILISLYLAKKNYKPVKGILNIIDNIYSSNIERGFFINEISLIERSINDLKHKVTITNNENNFFSSVALDCFLYKTVTGLPFHNKNKQKSIVPFCLMAENASFLVFAFQICIADTTDISISSSKIATVSKLYELVEQNSKDGPISFHIVNSNLFDERIFLLANWSNSMSIEISDTIAYDSVHSFIKTFKDTSSPILKDNYIASGVGIIVRSPEILYESFSQAAEDLKYSVIMGAGEITFNCSRENENPLFYNYSIESEIQLLDSLKTGEFVNIHETIDEIIKKSLNNNVPDLFLLQCLFYELFSTLIRGMKCIKNRDVTISGKDLQALKSIGNMAKFVEKSLQSVVSETQVQGDYGSNNIIRRFIDDNCFSPDISLNYIAENLSVSQYMISKLFSGDAGSGFTEYINSKRVTYAVELLIKTNCSISKIANDIGFSNENTFIRTFKRHKGVSPGQFRQLNSKH